MKEENTKYYDKTIQVNRYPFWLLWNYRTVAFINMKNNILETEHKKTSFRSVPPWQMFITKYVPVILFILFVIRIPNNINEYFLMSAVGAYMFVSRVVFIRSVYLFKLFTIATIIIFYVLFFKFDGSGRTMNMIIGDFINIFIVSFVVIDFFKNGYKGYYYLEDVQHSGRVTISKYKKRAILKIPFTKKHLIKMPTGFNAGFDYGFGGYYFKVVDESTKRDNQVFGKQSNKSIFKKFRAFYYLNLKPNWRFI